MSRIEEWTDKLADRAVFGADVQPGQLVAAAVDWSMRDGEAVPARRTDAWQL